MVLEYANYNQGLQTSSTGLSMGKERSRLNVSKFGVHVSLPILVFATVCRKLHCLDASEISSCSACSMARYCYLRLGKDLLTLLSNPHKDAYLMLATVVAMSLFLGYPHTAMIRPRLVMHECHDSLCLHWDSGPLSTMRNNGVLERVISLIY